MNKYSEKLNLTLPGEEEFYDVEVFNNNFKKIDAAYEVFEDNTCIISEDGLTVTEVYRGSKRVAQINGAGNIVIESIYGKNDVLLKQYTTTIEGNTIHEAEIL